MTRIPDISFFRELAGAAAAIALSHYRKPIAVEEKVKPGYRFDPVTIADKEAEKAIRALINREFPEHAILGEEFGETGTGKVKWVIDPIDGTKPFILGIPVWGTLIGLTVENRATIGMMSQPFTGELFWGDGDAAWHEDRAGSRRLRTRDTAELSAAVLHTNSPERYPAFPQINLAGLQEQVQFTRYGGECYAFAMLAAGQIDLCLEPSLQPYDIVALIPIIESAGGVVTDLTGARAEDGGPVLASANMGLHEKALRILNSSR